MSQLSMIREGRTMAESLMTDLCVITRASGDPVFDPATGSYTTPDPTVLYDSDDGDGTGGKCWIAPTGSGHVVEAGQEPVSLWPFLVAVPASVTGLAVDDVVEVKASAMDAGLVGAKLRIREVAMGSQITARRLGCELDAG